MGFMGIFRGGGARVGPGSFRLNFIACFNMWAQASGLAAIWTFFCRYMPLDPLVVPTEP